MPKYLQVAALIGLACGQAAGSPQATDPEQSAAPSQSTQKPAEAAAKPAKRGELAVAPIPVIDPTIGNGMALAVLYTVRLNHEDEVSPPSVFGAAGLRTSNGTWAFGGGAQLYLKQDRFRILVAGATGTANYKFYGLGSGSNDTSISITQHGSGILTGLLVRTLRRWYVGPRYYYFMVTTGLDGSEHQTAFPIEEVQFRLPVAALGAHIQRDTRDSQFYSRSGSVFDTKAYFSDRSVGALFQYQDYEMAFQQYFPVSKKQVVAYRVHACAVNGHAPFFALCSLGNSADMRGYPSGRYRDRRMLVGQVEYRREIWWRFGAVAFMGAGEVASTFGDLDTSSLKPGGGVGVRFAVAPKNHINIKADYGLGKGSHAWYLGIGEAF